MRQGAGMGGARVGKCLEGAGVSKLRPVWGMWQFCLDAAGRQAGPWQVCPGCRTYLRQRTAIRRPVSAIRSWSVEMHRFWYQKLSSPCTRCQTYCSHSWPHPCRVDPADCWHSYGFAHALGRWQFGTQFAGNSMQFGCIFGNSADLGAPGR